MNIENDIIQDELKCNWLFSQTITQGIHPVYICIHASWYSMPGARDREVTDFVDPISTFNNIFTS